MPSLTLPKFRYEKNENYNHNINITTKSLDTKIVNNIYNNLSPEKSYTPSVNDLSSPDKYDDINISNILNDKNSYDKVFTMFSKDLDDILKIKDFAIINKNNIITD